MWPIPICIQGLIEGRQFDGEETERFAATVGVADGSAAQPGPYGDSGSQEFRRYARGTDESGSILEADSLPGDVEDYDVLTIAAGLYQIYQDFTPAAGLYRLRRHDFGSIAHSGGF